MRVAIGGLIAILVVAAILVGADFSRLFAWTVEAQRGFQNQMAAAIRALNAGEAGAYTLLFSATAAYGFVHALGPGHGKYLVGGVGVASPISAARLVLLAVISSLLQALWAIVLVYGGFFFLDASARQLSVAAENYLAPLSYAAIGLVGLVLVWRGARSLGVSSKIESISHQAGCHGHAHGPTMEQAAQVTTLRQVAVLVASIAVRPCTGAIFLLVIAWQMDLKYAGAIAVVFMGLGTAALTGLVALASISTRQVTTNVGGKLSGMSLVFPIVQMVVGTVIALLSLGFLGLTV